MIRILTPSYRRAIKYADGWHPVNLESVDIVQKLEAWDVYPLHKEFEISVRRTVKDISSLNILLKSFENTPINYVLLKLPRNTNMLEQVSDAISPFV
ncbi:MAG: hypothetical protein ACXADL_13085 [Candidatus Thorarchaeota archaeon]|jgi:hypothetical protein